VYFYLGVLLTLPLVRYLFPKGRVLGVLLAYLPLILAALVWGLLDKTDRFTQYRELIVYYACVLGGFAFAKYSWFETVRGWFKSAKIDHWWFYLPLAILSLIAVSLIRNVLLFPFAALLILFACVYLFERSVPKWIGFPLRWLGTLSMPIWFIHFVFFADYINDFIPLYSLVMSPRISIVILAFALVLCVPVALIYCPFFAWIDRFAYKKNKKSV
jgi:peptidoglycan/LPS O-acetylase OafA/YrhL